jgi:hypothetical protein
MAGSQRLSKDHRTHSVAFREPLAPGYFLDVTFFNIIRPMPAA